MKDRLEKELNSRRESIKKELKLLFDANLKITSWDVSELDTNRASKMLLDIFREELDEIEKSLNS